MNGNDNSLWPRALLAWTGAVSADAGPRFAEEGNDSWRWLAVSFWPRAIWVYDRFRCMVGGNLPFVAVRIVAETEARVVREEMAGLKRWGRFAGTGQEMDSRSFDSRAI